MKRKPVIAIALLFVCVAVVAQKNESFLQKTEALIKQDNRIAAYEMSTKRGTPESIRFDSWNTFSTSETERLLQTWFISRKGVDEYKVSSETSSYGNISIVRYQQYFKGIKVEFGSVVAVSKDAMLKYMSAENYIPEETKTVIPAINESSAVNKALNQTNATHYAWQDNTIKAADGGTYPKGELVLMPDMRKGKTGMVLAWKFDVYATQPVSRDYVYISAEDGSLVFKDAIIKHANQTGTAATRYSGTKSITTHFDSSATVYQLKESSAFMNGIETYNMNRGTDYGASVIPVDNDNNWTAAEYNNANKDNALLDAHWGAEQVVAYWKTIHNRNSYDNNGAKIKSYVHYRTGYDNAFWNGSVMTYGDGSGGANGFSPLTALDVCAHEIGHAVCSSTSNLVYSGESGAMNEGFSDIWGACLENYADPANAVYEPFLIGEQISFGWVKGTNRNSLRDMANPPAQGNPDTYGGTNWAVDEVHNRSGVLNKWFYLITHGESGTNDLGNAYNVTGLGFAKAEQIAFLTEISLTPNASFAQARTAAINATFALYQSCAQETTTITDAWYAVGVGAAFTSATICDKKISFLSAGTTVTETVNSTDCHPGKPVICTMVLSSPITQNATVTPANFGTAMAGKDFTISPSAYTFTPGGPLRTNFTITVYDNAIDDGDRTLILNYLITGNGAIAGSQNQSYTLKITDDDAAPVISSQPTVSVTLLNESFGAAAFPAGWLTGNVQAGANNWTVGPNASTVSSGNAAYITNNGSTKPWVYTKTSTSEVYLLSPAIDASNITDMQLQFRYMVKGEVQRTSNFDYGNIVYSFDNGTTLTNVPNITLVNSNAPAAFSLPMADAVFANKTFRIGFRWRNDYTDGVDPPLAVDDIIVSGTRHLTNVENAVNANKDEYVVASSPVFFLSAQNKKIIARIINASASVGCVNTTLTQAGSGQVNLQAGFKVYRRTSKVFNFAPGTPDNTVTYRLKLYFTAQELATWTNDRLNLNMLMVKSGVDLNSNISSSDIKIVVPIITETGDGYIAYTGDFTGFGQIMLVHPVTTIGCSPTPASVVYVDSSKAESGDGLTWGSAFTKLDDALQAANQCSYVNEIRVAKGTYYPTADAIRDSSFTILRNGIKLYGGYPAGGAITRNTAANPTILSGNIGSTSSATDNSYHVLVILATASKKIDTSTRVDGFTISGGYANSFTSFSVSGQTIYHDNGGGIYCYGQEAGNSCKPYLVNCTFTNNRSNNRGGAVFNEGYNGGNSSPLLVNCVFFDNTSGYATGSGGTNYGGGALYNNGDAGTSSPTVINCSFYGNNANAGVGAAMYNFNGSIPVITNTIIYQNNNNSGNSNVWNVSGATFNISYSIVQGGPAGNGNINADPLFVNAAAGNLQLQQCSPAINTGNAAALPEGIIIDVNNNSRIFNATIDMGAYECRLLPATFTFKGAGVWNTIQSWQCNWVPPSPLVSGSEIIVDPVGGDCILNVPYTVGSGGKLTVKTGKKLVVQGNVQLK